VVVANDGPQSLSGSAGKQFSGLVVEIAKGQCGCSATIDWGDGSKQASGQANANSRGGVDVSGAHTYTSAGRYSIVVYLMACETECRGPLVRDAIQQTISIS
jgi:hypothetical protein